MALVLKTSDVKASAGSNPALSAPKTNSTQRTAGFFLGKTKKKGIKEYSGVQIKVKNAETTHNIGNQVTSVVRTMQSNQLKEK